MGYRLLCITVKVRLFFKIFFRDRETFKLSKYLVTTMDDGTSLLESIVTILGSDPLRQIERLASFEPKFSGAPSAIYL
jgi:hypothetical protein